MKKFFSLSSIKESIRLKDRKDSQNGLERQPTAAKRFSTLSVNSLSSKQSFLNIEVIREGYNVDLKRVDQTFTKLHRACLLNYDEKKLLKYIKKFPVNQVDIVCNSTPLHLCVVNNNLNHLNLLIQNGGDINLRDGIGKTLLIKAIELQNEQIIHFLIQNQADVNKPDAGEYKNSPLHWAILTGYFKGISTLLNCTHININQVNSNQETVLHLIAKSSKNLYVFLDDCLDNNLDSLDKQDSKGRTALFVACLVGNYHCVELLLNKNANPTINNLMGESPLQVAKSKGFVDIADLFENNKVNQFLNELRNSRPNQSLMNSKPTSSTNGQLNGSKSLFNLNSDVDFMKSTNDDDSWPISDTSTLEVDTRLKVIETPKAGHSASNQKASNDNSFNSFKMNKEIKSNSSSLSDGYKKEKVSPSLQNGLNNDHVSQAQSSNQLNANISQSDKKKEESNLNSNSTKQVLHPENDEFIKQMKFLIDEEIQMNEELDEILFIKQPETSNKDNHQINQSSNRINNIYLSDDDWADENDTLIKQPNTKPNTNPIVYYETQSSKASLRKQDLVYGLSDEDDDQKMANASSKSKGVSSEEELTLSNKNQSDKTDKSSDQPLSKRKSEAFINSDSSLSSVKSAKEDDLVSRFDSLMTKINNYDQQNQQLSAELNEALDREKELKKVNITLNQQYEEQIEQLNLLENRLKQSEENYKLIKDESEQFKNEFKDERAKFEKEFIKFVEEEHKQKERQLMKLLDDRQDMCNKLTDELNYLKEKYVNKDEIEFINDDLVKRLENNQLFNSLIEQNEKLNQNFQKLQTSLDEHHQLTESVKKLNLVLNNLEDQLKQQTNQFNLKLKQQKNEFSDFMETNLVQLIQNQFKNEVELKLVEVKSVVDELKQELIDFIRNYKLPKQNEQEITNLINQILSRTIKQQSVAMEELKTNEDREPKNETSSKDEKTSLEFDADDLFDERRLSDDKVIEVKRIKREKIKLNKLILEDRSTNRMINQYSDAILNSINLNNNNIKMNDSEISYQDNQYLDRKSIKDQFMLKPNSNYDHYLRQFNMNQLDYMQQINKYSRSNFDNNRNVVSTPFAKPRSQSDKFRASNQQEQPKIISNFRERRMLLEKDIANLKIQLGIFSTNKIRSSSVLNL